MNAPALSFTEQNYREVALQRGPHQNLRSFAKSASLHRSDPRVLPSVATETKANGIGMNTVSTLRKNHERRNQNITDRDTAERVSFALQAWGRDKSAPIERVRKIAGVDRNTAAAWFNGERPPKATHLVNLARKIPELKAECRRLFELEQECDPGFQRGLINLMQRYIR
jgi:transcriptional regulator with XRE-family HTH domain